MSNELGRPETLADILAEPGWEQAADGGTWYDVTDGAGNAFVGVDGHIVELLPMGFDALTPATVYRAADLIRRIEAAIAREAGE